MGRENEYLATFSVLKENRERLANKHAQAIIESENKRNQFLKNRENILESAELKRRRHGQLMEMCRDNALSIAIKGIFIGALEAGTLTDNGIILAETMVDNWIKEKGGAVKILKENKNKTYLLNRIAEIVEEAAILEAEEIEDIENDKIPEDKEEAPEEKSEENAPDDEEVEKAMDTIKNKLKDDEEAQKALKVIQNKVDSESDENEDSSDSNDEPNEENKEEDDFNEEAPEVEEPDKNESSDDSSKEDGKESLDSDDLDVEKDIAGDNSDNNSEELPTEEEPTEGGEEESSEQSDSDDPEFTDGSDNKSEEDSEEPIEDEEDKKDIVVDNEEDGESDESDVADDITDDIENPDEDLSVDGEPENKGKVLDELEKEDDVKKAVELIRQRVADAEENFIKRNAEDKKQVEELIGRISDNVKTVEDISDPDDPESKVAEESARMNKRKINEITSNRPLTVMEKMTRLLHSEIVKDQVIRESYLTENNTIDIALVVESAKVMYGFLETLNTLQLEKVDVKYIEKVLASMQ